jgi:hypothetical protein
MMRAFTSWVNATPLSESFKATSWLVPAAQAVHILAVGIVLSAVVMLTMRASGRGGRGVGVTLINTRFLPWIWWSILVLFATGIVQMIAEPGRALPNPYFQAKMAFLAIVAAALLTYQRSVRRDPDTWDGRTVFPARVRAMFAFILVLTLAIIFCGRWIAYSDFPQL